MNAVVATVVGLALLVITPLACGAAFLLCIAWRRAESERDDLWDAVMAAIEDRDDDTARRVLAAISELSGDGFAPQGSAVDEGLTVGIAADDGRQAPGG